MELSLKQSFTPEDWAVVIGAPHTVATAVMMAGFSGLGGTAKEAFSLATSLAQNMNSPSALIREVAVREELSSAQTSLRARTASLDPQQFKQQLNTMAVEDSKKAIDIISRQAPEEVVAYKQWLMDIASGVANAAKEGGFLGFGGERVSEGERLTLGLLSDALGMKTQDASA
jgi:hypothetical protein